MFDNGLPVVVYNYIQKLCKDSIVKGIYLNIEEMLNSGTNKTLKHVTYEVFFSIFKNEYVRYVTKTYSRHKKRHIIQDYVTRFKNGESIQDIAFSANFSIYLITRIIIEHMCGIERKKVSQFMKNLSLFDSITTLTQEERARLKLEIPLSIDIDEFYSPRVDRISNIKGAEFEYILMEKLRNRGIPFHTEDHLRERGFAKTPDVKLSVPIGVTGPDGKMHIIHWIDSKAMFGDPSIHCVKNKEQLNSYVNRFGSGLVIYWFDHVDSLNTDEYILVMNAFPDTIILPGAHDLIQTGIATIKPLRKK